MARLRVEKVQEAIKHEISKMLLHDVKDPRIQFVTVTGVELTDDMSYAKIFISMYGPKDNLEGSEQGIRLYAYGNCQTHPSALRADADSAEGYFRRIQCAYSEHLR